jgi:CheY-like chemotaxis protein
MEKKTILVVEDEDKVRQDLCNILRDVGYHIQEAANGKAGLQAYAEYGPNLVITDIAMPEVDGIELIRTIRKANLKIPIIAISGAWEYLEVADLFGANKAFYKPIQENLMLNSVQTLLDAPLSS